MSQYDAPPTPPTAPTPAAAAPEAGQDKKGVEILTSRQLLSWMAEQGLSLAFSTYQTGKIFFLGLGEGGKLSVFERTFNRCMGLCVHEGDLYLSTLWQVWRFVDFLQPGQLVNGYDRCYVPVEARTTGDIDIHDMGVDRSGRLVFVNTLFNCLARLHDRHSFEPVWMPSFVSKIAAEDRCHLNGMAMKDGTPAYVTAVSRSDAVDSWRDRRRDGGVLIEVATGKVVCEGLSMPHSPRWYRGKVWLLNSGTGELGWVDPSEGKFNPVCFCPGYLRGLAFHGRFAIIGSSKARENKTFQGLDLDDRLSAKGVDARCGLFVVDLETNDVVHWVRIEGMVQELYDVVTMPGVRRPMAIGTVSDEIRRTLSIAPYQEETLHEPL